MATRLLNLVAIAMFVTAWTRDGAVVAAGNNRLTTATSFEVLDRDKKGTNALPKNGNSSQMPGNKANASCVSFGAEGTGLEPATGFPAPHFQCGR